MIIRLFLETAVIRTAVLCSAALFALPVSGQRLIDKDATSETVALYHNLFRIAEQGFMFGHQDTDAYGVGGRADSVRSDVKDVTGSFPAVHGWDLGKIGQEKNLDGVDFRQMRRWIIAARERGGVNTISWHVDNPVTGESSWSKGAVVKSILPGGVAHAAYLTHLDHVALFLDQLEIRGSKVPVIFRPFHEHNGDWFWWGKGHCTEEEYVALWRFTVDYLKNKKNLHHLIYAFSPDRSRLGLVQDLKNFRKSYLYGYPGDEWVDIIGYDNYWDVGSPWNKASEAQRLRDLAAGLAGITAIAAEKGKVAAVTETGLEKLEDKNWYTKMALAPVKGNRNVRIAYLLVWRNDRPDHHYAPYPGHPAVEDFLVFFDDPETLFESDIQNLYSLNKPLIRK